MQLDHSAHSSWIPAAGSSAVRLTFQSSYSTVALGLNPDLSSAAPLYVRHCALII
jgi:hypothetical protein